jgi:hypothetical protein
LIYDLGMGKRGHVTADRRRLITPAQIMERTGAGRSTIAYWYANRATNGHPEAIRSGRNVYYDADAWWRWYNQYKQALSASLTTVDRSGDPGELVNAAQAAQVMGYRHRDAVRSLYRSGHFPEPDLVDDLPSGRKRRLWRRDTIWAHADARTYRGSAGGRPAGSHAGKGP